MVEWIEYPGLWSDPEQIADIERMHANVGFNMTVIPTGSNSKKLLFGRIKSSQEAWLIRDLNGKPAFQVNYPYHRLFQDLAELQGTQLQPTIDRDAQNMGGYVFYTCMEEMEARKFLEKWSTYRDRMSAKWAKEIEKHNQ